MAMARSPLYLCVGMALTIPATTLADKLLHPDAFKLQASRRAPPLPPGCTRASRLAVAQWYEANRVHAGAAAHSATAQQ